MDGSAGVSPSRTSDGDSEPTYAEETQKESVILADDYHYQTNGHREAVVDRESPHQADIGVGVEVTGLASRNRERYFATLLSGMTDIELDRYEAFRRSCLPRSKMKKLVTSLSSLPVHDDKILIVICSLAKMFVGQLIAESRKLAVSVGESGPLRPEHVRKAFKMLEYEGLRLRRRSSKPLFRIFT